MGVAFVKGMQGDDPYYLKTVSTPKHFIANNEEERRHTGSSMLICVVCLNIICLHFTGYC